MKTCIITQARCGSSRLPRKILKKIGEKTLLEIHLERLKKVSKAEAIIVATTFEYGSEEILEIAERSGVQAFQGSTEDVLDRYWQAAMKMEPDAVVRVTSDCPLVDPETIDSMIKIFETEDFDYLANTQPPTFPDGMDVEIFTLDALGKAWSGATNPKDREHVTHYFYTHPDLFRIGAHRCEQDRSSLRLTVDYEEDYLVIADLVSRFGAERSWEFYADELEKNPALARINNMRARNEGF
jgi:spore coat polysaccharide biosynthesis protein SpsF